MYLLQPHIAIKYYLTSITVKGVTFVSRTSVRFRNFAFNVLMTFSHFVGEFTRFEFQTRLKNGRISGIKLVYCILKFCYIFLFASVKYQNKNILNIFFLTSFEGNTLRVASYQN